jgi:hypothetical protein
MFQVTETTMGNYGPMLGNLAFNKETWILSLREVANTISSFYLDFIDLTPGSKVQSKLAFKNFNNSFLLFSAALSSFVFSTFKRIYTQKKKNIYIYMITFLGLSSHIHNS